MPVLLTIKRELCNRWLCINYASINSKLQIPLPHWTPSENLNYRRSVRWTIHLSGPKSCSHAQRKDQIWWSILLFYCKRQNQRPWLSIHRLSLDIVDLFFWAICSQRWSLRLKTPPCWKIPAQIPHPLGTGDSQMLRERGEGVLKLCIDQRNIRFPFFIRGGFHTLDDRYHDHVRELHLISAQIRSHWFCSLRFRKLVGLAGSRFLVTNKQSRKHEDIPQCALTLPEKQQKLMCT